MCVEDDGTLRVVSSHHLHGEPVDGGLEVGLLRVHHHAHVLLLGVLQQPRLSSPLLASHDGVTLNISWSLLTMFLNCSSSSAVSAPASSPVMSFSILPVSRLGTCSGHPVTRSPHSHLVTWNVSPRPFLVLISPDQSNKWIKLKENEIKNN